MSGSVAGVKVDGYPFGKLKVAKRQEIDVQMVFFHCYATLLKCSHSICHAKRCLRDIFVANVFFQSAPSTFKMRHASRSG